MGRPAASQAIRPPSRFAASRPCSARYCATRVERPPEAQTTSSGWSRWSPISSTTWLIGTCCDPAMWPSAHSASVRTSTTRQPAAISSLAWPGSTSFTSRLAMLRSLTRSRRAAARSAEQLGQSPVGQLLAARLAGGAVLQRGVGEGHLGDGVAADGARQAGLAVDPHPRLLLALEVLGGQALGARDCSGELALDGGEQGVALVVGQ